MDALFKSGDGSVKLTVLTGAKVAQQPESGRSLESAPILGSAGSGMTMAEIENEVRDLGEFELSSEESVRAEQAILEAEKEQEARISFRWRDESLAVVKRAALKVGVPYQTYMKVVLYERALLDLKDTR